MAKTGADGLPLGQFIEDQFNVNAGVKDTIMKLAKGLAHLSYRINVIEKRLDTLSRSPIYVNKQYTD